MSASTLSCAWFGQFEAVHRKVAGFGDIRGQRVNVPPETSRPHRERGSEYSLYIFLQYACYEFKEYLYSLNWKITEKKCG